jgi:asparagine synthase (glutamine-hydrolysing)
VTAGPTSIALQPLPARHVQRIPFLGQRFGDIDAPPVSRSSSTLHAISQLEISCFLGERLLRDTDAASMAVSLEVRVPLVDHTVVAAAAALPDGTRFAPLGKKLVLRHTAMGRLEEQLFERPKSGFVLPIER